MLLLKSYMRREPVGTSVVPEIRVLAPSMERGLDEFPIIRHEYDERYNSNIIPPNYAHQVVYVQSKISIK